MDNMTLTVIFLIFTAGIIVSSKEQDQFALNNNVNNIYRNNDVCLQSNIICPPIDGNDSIYGSLPDCTKFCQCSNGVPYLHNCPEGLHFNPNINVCDWPENAGCTGGNNPTTTATQSNTTTESTSNPTTTTEPNICTEAGILCPAVDGPDSVYGALPDCTKFCQCSNGVPYVHNCPFGLHFNPVLNVCDWPENAGCGQNTNTTAAATTTTQAPNPTTEVPETTTSNECIQANITCPAVDGPDSTYGALPDCTKFCQCSNAVPYVHNCPFGLHFNPVLNVCDWPENAGCGQNTNTTAAATTTTQAPNPTTEVPETTTSNECIQANIICPAVDGPDSVYGALPDCTKFCQCSNGVPYVHNCPSGLHFNLVLNVCDWPENAGCNGNTNSTTASTEYTSTAENGETNTENSTTEANIITENGNSTEYIETTETYISTNQENFTTEVSITTENEESPAQNSDTTEADITTQNENSSTEDSVTTEKYSTPEVEISTGSTVTAEAVVTNDNGNTSSDEADTTENETSPTDGTITSEEAVSTEEETSTENSVTTEEIITTDNINTTQNSVTPTTEVSTENGSETDDSIPCSTVIITETIITTTVISGTEYCLQNNIKCPDVDGEKSVYGALPDCTKFCQCSNGIPQLHSCSKGLQFNPELNECVLPEYAGCSNKTSTSVNPNAVTEITTECNADDSTTEKTTSAPNTDNTGLPTNNTAGHDNTAVPDNDEDENSGTKLCREYNVVCPVVDPEYPVFTALPDCTKYCKCSNGTPYLFGCPANLHFNPDLNVCDWPQNAGCKTAS